MDPKGISRHMLSVPMSTSRQRRHCLAAVDVDVAVMALDPAELPASATLQAFDESHLESLGETVGVRDPVTTVGFPLGDSAHAPHLPLARSGAIASSFGPHFESTASFLAEIQSHPSSVGSSVVRRRSIDRTGHGLSGWQLIGIQGDDAAAGTEGSRSGLHQAWYADILMPLTDEFLRM